MTPTGKKYKELYRMLASRKHLGKPIDKPIEMGVRFYFKDNIKRDLDNFSKILNDSLQWIIYENDTLIYRDRHEKLVDKDNPRVEVYIKEL